MSMLHRIPRGFPTYQLWPVFDLAICEHNLHGMLLLLAFPPAGLQAGLQHAQSADSSQEPQLPASGLQLQPEASQDPDHQGEEEVPVWQCIPFVPRDSEADQAGGGCKCPVQAGQCRCFPAGRWPAVHLLPCGTADRHVQIQVQADEADQDVQGELHTPMMFRQS